MTVTLPNEWLRTYAEADSEAPAVVFADTTLSYGELDRRAERHAVRLAAAGVGPGILVPVEVALNPESIVELMGVDRAGGVAVPAGEMSIGANQAVDDDVSIIVPTSGSSGTPRGVLLTKQNIAAAIDASQRRLGNGPADRWLLTLPLSHVGGLSVVWRSLAAGGSIHLLSRFEADTAIAALRERAVTMASLVPTMLHRILERDPGPYGGLASVLLGGAPASAELVQRAIFAGLPVLQTYGMTEACSQVATVEPGTAIESLGTVGPPLSAVILSIDDGEILVDGPTVSPGYLGEPPRYGPHHSGDIGYLDDHGRLVVTGRTDDVIITGGENVHPSTIEAVIASLPMAGQAVVVGAEDDEWGHIVVAVVEAESDQLPEIERIVRLRVARHEVPRSWVAVRELPLLANGKPDRAASLVIAETAVRRPG
ncbi:MAG: AMP-binding protein [Acidimicrobiia bacterium]